MEEKGEDGIDGDAIEEEAQVRGEAEVRALETEEGVQGEWRILINRK